MKLTVLLPVLFALSIHATSSASSPEQKNLADPGTDQVPPIGLPPIKIPANDQNFNLPLDIQIDSEGNPVGVLSDEEASGSITYSFLEPKQTPVRSAASKIEPCDAENVERCNVFKAHGATACSASSLGTACSTPKGEQCSVAVFDSCIEFTGANGVFCSSFGCAQYSD